MASSNIEDMVFKWKTNYCTQKVYPDMICQNDVWVALLLQMSIKSSKYMQKQILPHTHRQIFLSFAQTHNTTLRSWNHIKPEPSNPLREQNAKQSTL